MMTRKRTLGTVVAVMVLSVPVLLWIGQFPTSTDEESSLPGTVLSDVQMQNVRGGTDVRIEWD